MSATLYMESLHSKSIMQQLSEQAKLSKFKERSHKQNNSLIISSNELNRNTRISSLGIPSSQGKKQSLDFTPSNKFQFDKNKIEMNQHIIIPMPQVSINQLTKMKNPSLIRQNKKSTFDYIEADKQKYYETLKYLSQQKLQAAQRLQRHGSIKLRQRQSCQASPSSRRNININNQTNSMTPAKKNSIFSGGFNESLSKFKMPQKQSLFVTSSPQKQCDESSLNSTQNHTNYLQNETILSEFKVEANKNNFKRDSFFKRSSLNKSCSNLLRNPNNETMNKTNFQKNFSKERPSIFQSIFNHSNANMDMPEVKENDREQMNTEELDTATSVKNHTKQMNDFIRSRLGSTRRSSQLSNNNEDDKANQTSHTRFSFLQNFPKNKIVLDKLEKDSEQYQQDVIKSLQEDKLLSKLNKIPDKKEGDDIQGNKASDVNGFKQFAFKNFKPDSLKRLQTFFSFAFNSMDKSENKYIICALNELMDDVKKQGSMQIIDLWSAKSLKNCIERTNMGNERFVVSQFLHYKAKFDNQQKKEQMKQSEVLSLQKEQELKDEIVRQEMAKKQIDSDIKSKENSFQLEDDHTQYSYNQQMLMNSGSYNLKYKRALNSIIEEIKDLKQENIEDLKNQKQLCKNVKTFSRELETKYKLNKQNKR